jgi:ABC-2 type transport system ATP-binding protein
MDILEVKNIIKKFKNFMLQDIDFTLSAGYIMGYVGQNGAGKTTTLNLITHLLNADSGEIKINGITYDENSIAYKDSIGFIGDESYFPQEFTLKDIKSVLKDFYPSFKEKKFISMTKDGIYLKIKRLVNIPKV